jgi:polyhydroxyalkanoate synthesis regulator phasin
MARSQTPRDAADQLRTAVDRTLQATVGQATASRGRAQERAQDIVEELSQAAGRVRDALDDLRVATREDVKEIGDRLAEIESRVAKLETAARKAPSPARAKAKPAAKKAPAAKPKPKAKRAAGK